MLHLIPLTHLRNSNFISPQSVVTFMNRMMEALLCDTMRWLCQFLGPMKGRKN